MGNPNYRSHNSAMLWEIQAAEAAQHQGFTNECVLAQEIPYRVVSVYNNPWNMQLHRTIPKVWAWIQAMDNRISFYITNVFPVGG